MNAVVVDVELRKGACLTKLGGVVIYKVSGVSLCYTRMEARWIYITGDPFYASSHRPGRHRPELQAP